MLDSSLWLMLGLCSLLGLLAYARGGAPLVQQGFEGGGRLILRYSLVIAVSFLAAGFAELLLPKAWSAPPGETTSGLLASGLACSPPLVRSLACRSRR
jgi:hypothetical protein